MKYSAVSDAGVIRDVNEDSYDVLDMGYPEKPAFFLVADGMGGHNAGEIASNTAVKFVKEYIINNSEELFSPDDNKIMESIEKILWEANSLLRQKSRDDNKCEGMGTTFILACIFNGKIYVGHVGDSRAYIIRGENIIRITEDHSYTEELVKLGRITREQAEEHPGKNVITRALGCKDDIDVDKYVHDIFAGDTIVLCTDGLSNKLGETDIARIVIDSRNPEEASRVMIDMANRLGGEDNVTVIVVQP